MILLVCSAFFDLSWLSSVGSTLANAKAWGPLQAIIKADFVSCFDTIDHTLLMVWFNSGVTLMMKAFFFSLSLSS